MGPQGRWLLWKLEVTKIKRSHTTSHKSVAFAFLGVLVSSVGHVMHLFPSFYIIYVRPAWHKYILSPRPATERFQRFVTLFKILSYTRAFWILSVLMTWYLAGLPALSIVILLCTWFLRLPSRSSFSGTSSIIFSHQFYHTFITGNMFIDVVTVIHTFFPRYFMNLEKTSVFKRKPNISCTTKYFLRKIIKVISTIYFKFNT